MGRWRRQPCRRGVLVVGADTLGVGVEPPAGSASPCVALCGSGGWDHRQAPFLAVAACCRPDGGVLGKRVVGVFASAGVLGRSGARGWCRGCNRPAWQASCLQGTVSGLDVDLGGLDLAGGRPVPQPVLGNGHVLVVRLTYSAFPPCG